MPFAIIIVKILPTWVLCQLLVKLNLTGGNGIEVLTFFEFTNTTVCSIVITIYVISTYRRCTDIGAKTNIGILNIVEEFELMPTNEIPVAVAVEYKFATATTANLPKKA